MNSIEITSNQNPIDMEDIEKAMQRGRRLRAEAITSFVTSLFQGKRSERDDRKAGFSPDCAAPA